MQYMEVDIDKIKEQYPEYKPDKHGNRFKDITGDKFGQLTVLYRTNNGSGDKTMWVCSCDCGKIICKSAQRLEHGTALSCGCIRLSRRKYNEYDLTNDYGIGYTNNTQIPFYFDKEDYDKIKNYTWFENDQGYIITTTNRHGMPALRMHRLIMNIDDKNIIDHKNNNRADNRKENLRLATKQTNSINRGCNKTNKLGVKGVEKIKNGRYIARIMFNGKTQHIGTYDTIEEARQARLRKEIELFGEFAYQ